MRCFFALPLPEANRTSLGRWMASHEGFPWVRPHTLHFTLAFLGELSSDQVSRASACGAAVAARHAAFPLATAAFGRFPRAHGAQVLFLEAEPQPRLHALVRELRQSLATAGLPFDAKPFRAHLTLARLKAPRDLPEPPPCQGWLADRLVLFESHLDSEGARHEVRNSWGLSASNAG